jgi:hypothetical protein
MGLSAALPSFMAFTCSTQYNKEYKTSRSVVVQQAAAVDQWLRQDQHSLFVISLAVLQGLDLRERYVPPCEWHDHLCLMGVT